MKNTVGNFQVSEVNTQGTSLIKELPKLTNKKVKEIFGFLPAGLKDKYSNGIVLIHKDEKVVPSTSFWAEDSCKGIYTLYTCGGEWRIGGFPGNQHTEELAQLLSK